MPMIHSVATVDAPHHYDQQQLTEALVEYWGERIFNPGRLVDFHRNVMVGGRNLAVPIERLRSMEGFGEHNDAWIEVAVPMAERGVTAVLERAGLDPADVGLVASTTVTGLAIPSLEARIMGNVPLARDVRRMPLFGLGCLGGVAGVNRVADYLEGHPRQAALMVSVELCSLTLQRGDLSVANIVSTGLFGDGGAVVLLVGDEHPLADTSPLRIRERRSAFYPGTERVMGWDVVDDGFKVVLAPTVPEVVADNIPREVERLLADAGPDAGPLEFFVGHPGGPKVLDTVEEVLELPRGALDLSRDSLVHNGNMSSASVLFILAAALEQLPRRDSLGLMFAFGPAFSCELALLQVHAAPAARPAADRDVEPRPVPDAAPPSAGSAPPAAVALDRVEAQVIDALRVACELADAEIRSEHRLQEDLGLESIQLLALALHLENTFQIFLDEAPDAPPETVADVARLVATRLAEQGRDD